MDAPQRKSIIEKVVAWTRWKLGFKTDTELAALDVAISQTSGWEGPVAPPISPDGKMMQEKR